MLLTNKKRMSALVILAELGAAPLAQAAPLLWISDSAGRLGTVDVATGATVQVGAMGVAMTDLAFDPSGQLWGISFTTLYRIDTSNAAVTTVGALGTSLNSLTFGADGTLYAANNSLYRLNTATGAASLIGAGNGYNSAGDLAFIGDRLLLSSSSGQLVELNESNGLGTVLGGLGLDNMFGLATDNNVDLYGVAGNGVYAVNTATGASNLLVNYSGLGAAFGSAFFAESSGGNPGGGQVPLPSALALGLLALGAARWASRRR